MFRRFRDQRPDGTDLIRRSDGYGDHSGYGGGHGGGCSLPGPCALLGVGALLAVGAAAVTAIILSLQGSDLEMLSQGVQGQMEILFI